MGWAVQNRELETGARLAIALWWFWLERGYLSDGRRRLETILTLDRAEDATREAPHKPPARTKAYLLHVAGSSPRCKGTTIMRWRCTKRP